MAIVTPFTESDEIDFIQLKKLIDWHIACGTSAIVLSGTTGESPTLSFDEKIALAKGGVKIAQGRIPILFGNGSNSTRSAIALTKAINKTGIDGYLTVTPYYNKPTDAGLIAHFSAIAKATSLPIVLYNVPARTGCDMGVNVIKELAKLDNVVAIKEATGELERVQQLAKACGPGFTLLSGDDATYLDFCLLGGHGVISVTANIAPKEMAQIQQLLACNKIEQAKLIDDKLAGLHHDLFIEANPITIKWAMYKQQLLVNPNLRLPLVCLSEEGQQKITQTMNESGLFSREF